MVLEVIMEVTDFDPAEALSAPEPPPGPIAWEGLADPGRFAR